MSDQVPTPPPRVSNPGDRWVTSAASLWERLDALERCDCHPPCGLGADPVDLAAVVQALGGAESARCWLTRAGVPARGIAAVLRSEECAAGQCVSRYIGSLAWARCARDALKALEVLKPRVLEPPPGTTLPLFPEVSAQLAREATRQVVVPNRPGFDTTFACARVQLWRNLGGLIQHLLAANFQAFRALSGVQLSRMYADSRTSDVQGAAVVYRRWLIAFRESGARDIANDYPVLFRLIGEMIAGWVAATSELFDRLDRDWPELAATFGFSPSAALDGATFGLSDPHDGRRQVVLLRVGDRRFYYKPRSLDGEELWLKLLNALAASRDRCTYHAGMAASPLVLRHGYGYVAESTRTPLERHRIEEYHRELGAVLALFYAVNGTDGHMQNLVVSRGHPVIVDLETVLDAPMPATELPGSSLVVTTQGSTFLQRHSVASTGLLPQWVEWDDERVLDYSGIGANATGNDLQVAKHIVVENHGSVNLRIREEPVAGGHAPSIPLCDGEEIAATDYVDAVAAGFREGYRCIEQAHDQLLKLCATDASSKFVRQVLRPTRRYAAVTSMLEAPRWLTSGVMRTAGILEALHQPWMDRSAGWPPVVMAEARALDKGDIPLFSTRIDDAGLQCGGERIASWFAETPLANLASKLRGLSSADLTLQDRLIRLSFAARAAGNSSHAVPEAASPREVTSHNVESSALDHVDAVVQRLQRDAIDLGECSAWLTLAYNEQTGRYDYRLADHGIFSGSAGTAMFLAAANPVPTNSLAIRALIHSVQHLADAGDLMPCVRALALLRTAYTAAWLVRCGQREESVLFLLQEAVAAIDPSVLREDKHLDVLFGCASGLLASSRASEVFHWPRLLDCASVCSETLVTTQQLDGIDAGGWRTDTFPSRCITGFSHGASGIVYALAAGGDRDDPQVVRAIEMGLRFELDCFDAQIGTWRRWRDADGHGNSWCHGAPGIGLSRAGMIRAGWDHLVVREDLMRALDAARREILHIDTFCCGAIGVSEMFLTAAEVLPGEGLAEEGREVLMRTVLRRSPECYEIGTSTNAVCHPGLYQGWPGIAHGLARSQNSAVPSFALWDLPQPN